MIDNLYPCPALSFSLICKALQSLSFESCLLSADNLFPTRARDCSRICHISLVTYFHVAALTLPRISVSIVLPSPIQPDFVSYFCLCDKIFLPELTLRFVATFVVRISSAFPPDQSCQILFASILSVAGQTLYLPIYLSACAFQKRIFEMHIFQLCQEQ